MVIRCLGVVATTVALSVVPALAAAGGPLPVSVVQPMDASEVVETTPLDTVDPEGVTLPGAMEAALDDPGQPAVEAPVEVEDAQPGDQALTALSAPVPVGERDLALVGVSWSEAPASVRVDVRSLIRGSWSAWTPVDTDPLPGDGGGRGGSEPYLVVGVEEVQVRLHVADGERAVTDPELFVYAASASPEDERLDTLPATVTDAAAAEPSAFVTALYRPDAGGAVQRSRALGPPAALARTGGPVATAGAAPAGPVGEEVSALTVSTVSTAGDPASASTVSSSLNGYPPGTTVQAPRPTITPRAAWGAAAPSATLGTAAVQGAVVHHTAGSNTYTSDQVPAILRGIQRFHMESRGWSDIGYNMLVDKWGRLWEGRHGSLDRQVQGVHAAGYNSVSFGISVMGNYVDVTPAPAVVDSLARAIAWKLSASNVLADGRYATGLPAVIGHRDVAQTACPGRIQNQLGTIRSKARALQTIVEPALPRTMMLRDTRANGLPEVLRWDAQGGVVLTELDPMPVANGVAVGRGWTVIDQAAMRPASGPRDVPDLIARIGATGDLFAYHSDGQGRFTGRTQIGQRWGGMSHLLAPGDWDGDGVHDLLAVRRADGLLFLYPGRRAGGFAAPVQIGRGWGSIGSVTAPGDVDGDGRPDLVAVHRDGRVLLYPGTSTGRIGTMRHLATADPGTDLVVGAGDLNQDGHRDLITRASGRMTTWHGRTGATLVRGTTWGSGWGGMAPIVPAENWSGPGRTALLGASTSGRMFLYEGLPAGALRTVHPSKIPTVGADALFLVGDVRGDGTADVMTRQTDGRLLLHESTSAGTWRAPVQVGRGWQGFDLVTAAGDVDGDGVPDVLARERTTGDLRVYPLNRDGSFKTPFTVARGLKGLQIVAVGGWTATSSADIVTVDPATGAASLRRGRGTSGLAAPVSLGVIPKGQQMVGAGDFRRTGHNDLLALDGTGRLWLYPGSGTASLGSRIAVGGVPPAGIGALS